MITHVLIIMMTLMPGQAESHISPVLGQYIDLGLARNLALQQQNFNLEQSLLALKEAHGLFYPSLSLEARYSRAGGGRTLDIPIGDLMNPVYQMLNDIQAAQGQLPSFPTNLENEEIAFLREEEQETKLHMVQPLFQPVLFFNLKLKGHLHSMEHDVSNIYRRQLIFEIKKAYFTYLKTLQVVQLLQKTRLLVEENLRISEKLYQSDKVTQDVVYRSRAELSHLDQQVASAAKDSTLAQSYFNFLLNRELDTAVDLIDEQVLEEDYVCTYADSLSVALAHREEIRQLQTGIRAVQQQLKIAKTENYPGLVGVLDYGFEGENYRFSDEDDFWMASLVLQWNLFRGFQDRTKIDRSSTELRKLELRVRELENQISLQVREACEVVRVAKLSIFSSRERLTSARQSFEIVARKFEHGIVPHLVYLDARTTMTNAEINHILTRYDYQIHCAHLERVTASYSLDKNPSEQVQEAIK
ncbi:TolC family protein [candidate division CSSED10-310 bacterium]|uniref:TolC family protein n=1 Tax=candidate division CSSED10-310 bacterium TaxID=2855610 RepID=A0ABV6YY83_UNCC1